jgi:FkbM family methyltransferase
MSLKARLRATIIDIARRRGYDLTPHWKLASRPLVRHLKALFECYRVDCVFDVGGNRGQYHDMIREDVGFLGPIISFEPVSRYAAVLSQRALQDPDWEVCGYALGGTAGHAEIHVTRSPGLNSFLPPRRDMVEGFWSDDSVLGKETVEIRTLDAVFPDFQARIGFQRPYLKLDTQGFDLHVLRGGPASFRSIVGYQTEASIRPIYEGMPDYQAAIRFGTDRGFELSGMFPVALDPAMRLIEFDCVFVNSERHR